jgi:hypothetical protein
MMDLDSLFEHLFHSKSRWLYVISSAEIPRRLVKQQIKMEVIIKPDQSNTSLAY